MLNVGRSCVQLLPKNPQIKPKIVYLLGTNLGYLESSVSDGGFEGIIKKLNRSSINVLNKRAK
jgi:hypothetical protein